MSRAAKALIFALILVVEIEQGDAIMDALTDKAINSASKFVKSAKSTVNGGIATVQDGVDKLEKAGTAMVDDLESAVNDLANNAKVEKFVNEAIKVVLNSCALLANEVRSIFLNEWDGTIGRVAQLKACTAPQTEACKLQISGIVVDQAFAVLWKPIDFYARKVGIPSPLIYQLESKSFTIIFKPILVPALGLPVAAAVQEALKNSEAATDAFKLLAAGSSKAAEILDEVIKCPVVVAMEISSTAICKQFGMAGMEPLADCSSIQEAHAAAQPVRCNCQGVTKTYTVNVKVAGFSDFDYPTGDKQTCNAALAGGCAISGCVSQEDTCIPDYPTTYEDKVTAAFIEFVEGLGNVDSMTKLDSWFVGGDGTIVKTTEDFEQWCSENGIAPFKTNADFIAAFNKLLPGVVAIKLEVVTKSGTTPLPASGKCPSGCDKEGTASGSDFCATPPVLIAGILAIGLA